MAREAAVECDGRQVARVRQFDEPAGEAELGQVRPLLREWKIGVVAFGPSLHDKESFYLMRAFPSLQERDRIEEAFYASPAWRNGPRAAVLADIQSYTTIVIPADDLLLGRLRALIGSAAPGDPGQEDAWRSVARRRQSPNP